MTPLGSMRECTTFAEGGSQLKCFQGILTQGYWKIEGTFHAIQTSNILKIKIKNFKIVRDALSK